MQTAQPATNTAEGADVAYLIIHFDEEGRPFAAEMALDYGEASDAYVMGGGRCRVIEIRQPTLAMRDITRELANDIIAACEAHGVEVGERILADAIELSLPDMARAHR